MGQYNLSDTEILEKLTRKCEINDEIEMQLYTKYNVKKGLRDEKGKGVLAGLTNISTIHSAKAGTGGKFIGEGELRYRGYDINELVDGFVSEGRFGYEEVAYLLLFGELPTAAELSEFRELLALKRTLPTNFVRDVVMKAPSKDIMNVLARSVLTLASYDKRADDISLENVLEQSLNLIAVFPMLAVYAYHAYNHYVKGQSMYIHYPDNRLSTAENILMMLRPEKKYTHQEAITLDMALVLHMEHGGGNNSTFTTHVVTSSGTDTYSTIAAALGSLKGPKHGGANIKVMEMMNNIKENVDDLQDEEELKAYLTKILRKETFDQRGLIYGMGHAIYANTDPRAKLFERFVGELAEEKGAAAQDEYHFYKNVEKFSRELICQERKIYKGVSTNIDFFSGFVYNMLGLPEELFTPIFAIARIVGWSAHRMEELINTNKIIRPAYMEVSPAADYLKLSERK